MNSVTALRRLLPTVLTRTAARVFASGGVVLFGSGAAAVHREPIRIEYPSQDDRLKRGAGSATVRVATIRTDHGWASQTAGFMLSSAARARHLPIHVTQAVFTNITPAMQQRVTRAILHGGVPLSSLRVHLPYRYAPDPPGVTFGRYGGLLLLFVTLTVVLGSTARNLRKQSRSLVAIGVSRSWAWSAVAIQGTILTVIGLAGGFIVGAACVWLTTVRSGYEVAIPVTNLVILVGATVAIAVTIATLASIGTRPRGSSS